MHFSKERERNSLGKCDREIRSREVRVGSREKSKKESLKIHEREREKGDKILSLTRVVRLSLVSLSGDILSVCALCVSLSLSLSLSLSQIYGHEFFVCVSVFMM